MKKNVASLGVVFLAMLPGNVAAQEDEEGSPSVVGLPNADFGPKMGPGSTFRDRLRSGGEGPEMIVIPAGKFRMGCLSGDAACYEDEKPVRQVSISRSFALSAYEVTFEDYDRFTYPEKVDDEGWGRGRRPVIHVSWNDAQAYVAWLSGETGEEYRLPSESEWEYAARAGSTTAYSWGNEVGVNRANCGDWEALGCRDEWDNTAPVGSFSANGFGLYDMHGNVWEWVEDCWQQGYAGAPLDGGAWRSGDCAKRVLRGGSWIMTPGDLRASAREWWVVSGDSGTNIGFRVARTLRP